MQVICPQCATRLQLSAPKLPDHPFTIKCPKCHQGITVSPATEASQPAPMETLSTSDPLDLSDDSTPKKIASPEPVPPVVPPPMPVSAAPESSLPSTPQAHVPPPPTMPQTKEILSPTLRSSDVRPASDLPLAEANLATGWTNSMPSPTVSDDSNTLFTGQVANRDILQALTTLLSANGMATPTARLEQHRRRSVVTCLANQEDTKKVEAVLNGKDYEVIAASSPEQVTSMLQTSHQLDVLLLDPNFYAGQQGGATIMRYLNMLNPARRRRVFVVVTSHSYRTMDMQAAFVHGVNMIVNSGDLESLPQALSKSITDFNDLYRAFNRVNGINAF